METNSINNPHVVGQLITIWQSKFGPVEVPDNVLSALRAAYSEGVLRGVAVTVANAPPAPPQDRRAERLAKFEGDLELAKRLHPEIDFNREVIIKRTRYAIVGFNRNAPKHAFIIEGPQGGTYKCPAAMVVRGQQ